MRYLELGSVGALVQDLDRKAIRTKQRAGAKPGMGGGVRLGVDALAYLLKNRLAAFLTTAATACVLPIREDGGAALSRRRRSTVPVASFVCTASKTDRPPGRAVRDEPHRGKPSRRRKADDAGNVTRVSAPEIEAIDLKSVRGSSGSERR
jgi:hypothetical protein